MALSKTSQQLDRLGMTASTLCAVHCALVPIFFNYPTPFGTRIFKQRMGRNLYDYHFSISGRTFSEYVLPETAS